MVTGSGQMNQPELSFVFFPIPLALSFGVAYKERAGGNNPSEHRRENMTYHAEDIAPSAPYAFNPGTLVRETTGFAFNPITGEAVTLRVLSTSQIDRRNGLLYLEETNNFHASPRRHKLSVRSLMAA